MPSNFLDKLQEALNPSDSAIKGSGLIVGMSAVLIAATAVTNPIAASMLLCAGMSVSLQVITDCIEGNKTSISSLVTSAAVGAASGAVAGVTAAATEIAITELGYNAASHFAVATVSGASGATYDVTTQLLTTGKVDAKEVVLSTALAFGTGYALSKGSEVVSNKLNSKAVVAEKTENTRLFLQDETGEISLFPNKEEVINYSEYNNSTGWHVGDPIDNLTSKGKEPSWSAVRSRYWKNEAYYNSQLYSEEDLFRMKRGLAPQRINPYTNSLESKELHHIIPRRKNGPNTYDNLLPVWPEEHSKIDPYRIIGR